MQPQMHCSGTQQCSRPTTFSLNARLQCLLLQDVLDVLHARTAGAALMRAACSTTASLLVHLCDADTKPFEACGLLDAIVCE
jgi:hypothetical protein